MDLDLEIISEEGDCPDPLFDSIMNAMNSMKEATADKIYQKIQRDGETNYSKPQVDRALASALKYGIFEVRNNRYRVRDDIIDDEDTVYWKLQKKKEQTPFRIQEDNERQFGPKLDPEKDNLRFRKLSDTSHKKECPQCGRVKRRAEKEDKLKPIKKSRKSEPKRKCGKTFTKEKPGDKHPEEVDDEDGVRDFETKRKMRSESLDDDRSVNMKRTFGLKQNYVASTFSKRYFSPFSREKTEENIQDRGKYDSSDSEGESVSSPSDDEQSFRSYSNAKSRFRRSQTVVSDCDDVERPDNIIRANRSSPSIKSETDSEESEITSLSGDENGSKNQEVFFESLPCTSKNAGGRDRNQYMNSPDLYPKEYGRGQMDQCEQRTDWLGCSDEPQGTIIQTNNILTIEPMDSLAFKSPEQASYIS